MTVSYRYDGAEQMVRWAEERIEGCRFRDDAKAIGMERDGALVAVVVFDTFSPSSCFVSLAAAERHWFTREFAIRAMAYPFVQCRFARINCLISSRNRMSLTFTRQFGWRQEGVLREAGADGEDVLVFGMLRRECRYLSRAFGGAGKFGSLTV